MGPMPSWDMAPGGIDRSAVPRFARSIDAAMRPPSKRAGATRPAPNGSGSPFLPENNESPNGRPSIALLPCRGYQAGAMWIWLAILAWGVGGTLLNTVLFCTSSGYLNGAAYWLACLLSVRAWRLVRARVVSRRAVLLAQCAACLSGKGVSTSKELKGSSKRLCALLHFPLFSTLNYRPLGQGCDQPGGAAGAVGAVGEVAAGGRPPARRRRLQFPQGQRRHHCQRQA